MYSATKAAGESLCRTWAQEFGGKEGGVCYTISPFPYPVDFKTFFDLEFPEKPMQIFSTSTISWLKPQQIPSWSA
jgi:hypothetical protein